MTPSVRRALLAAAGLAFVLASRSPAAIIQEIVATVNGEAITMTDLQEQESDVRAAIQAGMSGDQKDQALDSYRQTLLVDMINQRLLYQRGERMGLDLNQVYKSYLENFKQQNNIKDNDDLMKLLQKEGMTLDEFRTFLLRRFVPEIMINIEVREKISVSDAEAQDYYQKNEKQFTRPASYTFREIALLLRSHSQEEALEIAGKIRKEAAAGADFESLVRDYSESPSRDQGGLVEDVPASEMAEVIRKSLNQLAVGQVSEPVETSLAVMIFKLESRTEAGEEPIEKVRAKIEAEIARSKYNEALTKYLKKLWAESRIIVTPKYQKMYPTDMYRPEGDSKPST